MKKILKLILSFVITVYVTASAQSNLLTGSVSDAKTGESLVGVTIKINEVKNTGTVTDTSGCFRLKIPFGAYSVTASLIGYQTVIKTDVIIQAGRETALSIKLQTATIEIGTVTVKGDYFDKSIQINNVSTVVLSAEEVRRSPGAVQDFQRILQSMPGVSLSSDKNNELLVRGGAPDENVIIFDDMEIHSINHYPNEYNSGGPINMLNVDLIQDIQFSTGGFNAKYGDKLSSVVIVNSREGRRVSSLSGNANISMAGIGGIFEGGFSNGSGSWLISARKSYLDLLKSAIGLTSVPNYYDGQFKIAYDFNNKHKISFSGIYGNDYMHDEGSTDEEFQEKAGTTDTVGIENELVKQNQMAVGTTLRSLWSKSLFSSVSLFFNRNHSEIDVHNSFTKRNFNSSGGVQNSEILTKRLLFGENFTQGESALKFEITWLADKIYELNAGISYRTGFYKNTISLDADSARFDMNNDGIFEIPLVLIPASSFTTDIQLFDYNKQYYYLNNRLKFFNERLLVNLGLRYDHFTYSTSSNLSPRFALSYYLIPQITSINIAFGYFYQSHVYPIYGDRYNSGINNHLKNSRAIHYVFGLEHILDDGLKFNLEAYMKKYSYLPVTEDFVHSIDRTFRSEKQLAIGEAHVYGIDAVLQQKLVKEIYGTLSLSYMNSKVEDKRIGYEGQEYSSNYEFPFSLTVILGKRFANLRDEINSTPFYVKYPTYLLPFSNDMEISFKWRYSAGRPYTPKTYVTTEQHREGGIDWGKGTWVTGSEINSSRYPAYQRLDLMFNSRYNFTTWNLVVSFSIQNLYNQKNIAKYSHNDDGTKDKVYQYAFFPVLGLEVEF